MHWATFGDTFMFNILAGIDEPDIKPLKDVGVFVPGVLKKTLPNLIA